MPATKQANAARPSSRFASTRRLSIARDIIIEDLTKIPKWKLGVSAFFACFFSAYLEFYMLFVRADGWRGWLPFLLTPCFFVGGAYIISSYAYPDHQPTKQEVISSVCYFVVFEAVLVVGKVVGTSTIQFIGSLFYVFVHFTYGAMTEQPATFAKYLLPPYYLLIAATGLLNNVLQMRGGYAVGGIALFYGVCVFIFLLVADRPLDKEKKKDTITNDGYYLGLYYQLASWSGIFLGVFIMVAGTAGTFVQSVSLQMASVLLLSLSQKVAIRATDEQHFAPLMLMVSEALYQHCLHNSQLTPTHHRFTSKSIHSKRVSTSKKTCSPAPSSRCSCCRKPPQSSRTVG